MTDTKPPTGLPRYEHDPTTHRVEWTIGRYAVSGRIICKGTECRLTHLSGDESCHAVTGSTIGSPCSCGGILTDAGHCNFDEWISNSGDMAEQYSGPPDQPLRDGPIIFDWEGQDSGYSWFYVVPEPAVPADQTAFMAARDLTEEHTGRQAHIEGDTDPVWITSVTHLVCLDDCGDFTIDADTRVTLLPESGT